MKKNLSLLVMFLLVAVIADAKTVQTSQDLDDDPNGPQETCATPGGCGGGEDSWYEGLFWQEYTIDCDISWSICIQPFGVGPCYGETTMGTKDKCKDGNSLCLQDFICSEL